MTLKDNCNMQIVAGLRAEHTNQGYTLFHATEGNANDLGLAFANYALDTNKLDNAEYDSSWDFTATALPDGATDGASLTSIVKTTLSVGGKNYTADAPQKFFGAKKN